MMDKKVIFSGALTMAIMGILFDGAVDVQCAVGLGLMWIGLAIKQGQMMETAITAMNVCGSISWPEGFAIGCGFLAIGYVIGCMVR